MIELMIKLKNASQGTERHKFGIEQITKYANLFLSDPFCTVFTDVGPSLLWDI